MSKGLFDKASLYREEFLDRPNEGLLAQALDYLNSKDKAETAAEMKIGGEPVLPPLPDASEFHPINEPTVADIMPDEETVRQRLAEIEAQVCAAEDSQSSSEVIPNADEADTDKDGETFFLEGDSVQEQQPDYEEEVLIIDLPRDDDPFAALLAQMGGDGESETMDNAQSTLHNEEDNPTDDESGNDDTSSDGNEGSVISTEAEKSDDEILNQVQDDDSSADDNSSEANEAGNDDAETAPTAEFVEAVDSSFDENIIEEVTQGTSFVGDAIVYDADAVTEKTFTDNNVSFTQLPPTDEPAPDVNEDLPTGILTADQSEDNETDNADNLTDDEISVPADDEDSDMAELPAVEDLPAAEDEYDESENAADIEEESANQEEENIEWIYPSDSSEDNEPETINNAQSTMHNEEDSLTDDESGDAGSSSDGNEGSVISTEAEKSVDGVSDDGTSSDGSEGSVISTEAEKSDDEILNQVQDDGLADQDDGLADQDDGLADQENNSDTDENTSSDEGTSKQYNDYLAVLDDISAQTASIAVDENMFDNFLACVADRFEIDRCSLQLFDPDDGLFKCMAKIGYDDETEEKLAFDLNYNGIYGNLANKKSYLVNNDEPQFGGLADIMSEQDFAETEFQLWIPFVFSSRIIGIMLVTHSASDLTEDYIRALEVAGRLNGAMLYNLYQQYTVMCEEYEDEAEEDETINNAQCTMLNDENESVSSDEAYEVTETMHNEDEPAEESVPSIDEPVSESDEVSEQETADDTEEIIEDDDADFSEEELAAELMSEWDNAVDNEQAEIPSVIEHEDTAELEEEVNPSVEPAEETEQPDTAVTSDEEEDVPSEESDTAEESISEESISAEEPVAAAGTPVPSPTAADDYSSIIIDESSFCEESETIHNSQCIMHNEEESEELEKVEKSVISTEANEESEAEKSTDNESIIMEDTGLALPEDAPVEVRPIPDDLDAKYIGLATFMKDLRESGAALSLCRVILTNAADVTAAVGEFSLISFAEDIKGTTQSIIGGDSFVEVTDPDKFYIVLPNAEKEEAQAATQMIIEQIVGLFSEAFGNAAEFRFECAANDSFTQSDYLALLSELS